jgi:hypothetical protein
LLAHRLAHDLLLLQAQALQAGDGGAQLLVDLEQPVHVHRALAHPAKFFHRLRVFADVLDVDHKLPLLYLNHEGTKNTKTF